MVKNKHLLIGVVATSLMTALICLVLLIRESKNGHELVDLSRDVQENGNKLSALSQDSQETRKTLENLEHRKVSELSSDINRLSGLQTLESKTREKELNRLIELQGLESKNREKELTALKAENKRLQDEVLSANGIKKRVDDLEKALKKLQSAN